MKSFQIIVFIVCLLQNGQAKLGSTRQRDMNTDKEVVFEMMDKNERLQTLHQLMSSSPGSVISLNFKTYRQLISQTPRNHSAFLLFYSSQDERTCPTCQEGIEAFYQLAVGYYNGIGKKNGGQVTKGFESVFFGVVYTDRNIRKFKLKLDRTLPNFYYFPESTYKKYNPSFKLEGYGNATNSFQRGSSVPVIAKWIHSVSGIFINARLAFETQSKYNSTFWSFAASLVVTIVFSMWRRGKFTNIYEKICGLNYHYGAVVTVIWLISGQMFNQIYGAPFGWPSIIMESQRSQTVLESFIVMFFYSVMSFYLVKLLEVRQYQLEENKKLAEISGEIWSAGMGFTTGLVGIMYIFKSKGF